MKQACLADSPAPTAKGKRSTAKAEPKAECTTADGAVLAYVQTEDEKRQCTRRLMEWYKGQQKIQKQAGEASKHPASGKPAKTAGWP